MQRYESVFDFYSEEPLSISVQKEKGDKIVNYEQILRIRKWNSRNVCSSWTVYSEDREKIKDIVIRNVEWDMGKDKKYVRENIKNISISMGWPSIIIKNNFIPSNYSKDILKAISELDIKVKNGILLEENMCPSWTWRDLEVKRLYDWGQIHSTWSTNMKNKDVENKIVTLVSIFESSLKYIDVEVESISINYSILPEDYIKLIIPLNYI